MALAAGAGTLYLLITLVELVMGIASWRRDARWRLADTKEHDSGGWQALAM